MDKAEQRQDKPKSIYNEPWCKDLIRRLNRYKSIKARMGTLEIMLEKSAGPSSSVVSSYGEKMICPNLGEANGMELEWRELKWEVSLLDTALDGLTEIRKAVVMLRYIEKMNYWHITDIYLPKHFQDDNGRPLYRSERTIKTWIEKSLVTMAETLGYIGKLHNICTKTATQHPKEGVE